MKRRQTKRPWMITGVLEFINVGFNELEAAPLPNEQMASTRMVVDNFLLCH